MTVAKWPLGAALALALVQVERVDVRDDAEAPAAAVAA